MLGSDTRLCDGQACHLATKIEYKDVNEIMQCAPIGGSPDILNYHAGYQIS